ncbi:MAG: PQQ-binding-like beta-propeller repeat protein [Pirellulaceae bacterium]
MNLLMAMTLVLAGAGKSAGESGDCWPAFRGQGDSHSAAESLPLTWSDTQGVAWTADLPGYGQSSPVVWRDRVFVTTMDGDNKETAIVLCFDLASGRKLWRKNFDASQQVKASNYVSRSAPTPVVDADRVYAFFESGDLIALTHDGEQVWKRSLTNEYGLFQGNHGVGSSPAITAETVIVLVSHDGPSYLLSVDKQTGENRWKVDREAAVSWSSPVVHGDENNHELFISSSGVVEAVDLRSGKIKWSIKGLEGNNVPSAAVGEELVIVGSSATGSNLAVRRGGAGDVSDTHVAWRLEEAASSFGSPLLYRGRAYFVNRSGVAMCVDAASGKTLWQRRLDGSCWASPIAAGERIYFFTKTGATTVAAAKDELEILAENTLTAEDAVVGVAAVNGRFLIRTPRKLVCIATAK